MTVASNPEVPRSKRYFVTCAIWTEKSIAAASSGMPNTPAMMSGRALSHRSFGSERPAYSANSSDIAHQHMGRFRQDAGRNADRARGPHKNTGRTARQIGSSRPLSHRSFGSYRPAYSANSSDIAPQHMGRFRQDAGRNADRARGPPQTVGRTHSQLGSSGPGHCD